MQINFYCINSSKSSSGPRRTSKHFSTCKTSCKNNTSSKIPTCTRHWFSLPWNMQ